MYEARSLFVAAASCSTSDRATGSNVTNCVAAQEPHAEVPVTLPAPSATASTCAPFEKLIHANASSHPSPAFVCLIPVTRPPTIEGMVVGLVLLECFMLFLSAR